MTDLMGFSLGNFPTSASYSTLVTGLTQLTDPAMLPGTHATVESFLTFAYGHTDRNETGCPQPPAKSVHCDQGFQATGY